MKTLRLAAPLACLVLLVACSKKSADSSAEAGGAAAASGVATTTSAAGPVYHCLKTKIARCEQTTAAQMAAAKAKLEAGTAEEKKFAGFMTIDGFKSMCGTGEYGEGACATDKAVGACVSITGKNVYYGGADGYKPDEFAYECSKDATPESADGKAMPKPAPQRMSCKRSKDSTCIEDDFKGKLSRETFCTPSAFSGPAELSMGPCPTEKRSASCTDAPLTFGGETRAATRVTYAYGAKAAAKTKSICGIMKGEFTKL